MAESKAENKKTAPAKPTTGKTSGAKQNIHSSTPLFGRENYRWMLIGIIIMALGLLLMSGGKSKDPNVFDPKQVYSFTRITLAPILILGGLALEIVAIFKKNKKTAE
ncbi:MAG: DUF3098 domain-containing protein [Puia sp.]|nr:DUF3098 domain-containing protein [Puia sp.]